MYCKNCGSEIDDQAVVCPKCGVLTSGKSQGLEPKTNTMAIVGLVMPFIFAIAGLICSIIARKQIRESGEKGMGLATAGLIISIVEIVLYFIVILIYVIVIAAALGSVVY